MSDQFYLQDSRTDLGDRLMFWRDGGGYTSNIDEAEAFTRERAVSQHQSRETDIPWPKAYIDARSQRACDCQYVSREDADALPVLGSDELLYAQLTRHWNGNDLIWLTMGGDHDADLAVAKRLSVTDAAELAMARADYVMWSQAYIDRHSRPVVTRAATNIKDALRGTGIKLVKPRPPRRDVYNCHGCGRFLSVYQMYGGDCPNCGADNLP